MTQEEAIKRTSEFLQKIFHDDKDSLEQLRLSCVGLKQIISNQITKEQIAKNNELSLFL